MDTRWTISRYSVNILRTLYGHSMNTPWTSYGHSMDTLWFIWIFCVHSMDAVVVCSPPSCGASKKCQATMRAAMDDLRKWQDEAKIHIRAGWQSNGHTCLPTLILGIVLHFWFTLLPTKTLCVITNKTLCVVTGWPGQMRGAIEYGRTCRLGIGFMF